MRAKLREVKEELRRRMHRPIPEQGPWLKQVVTGFFAYHALQTNSAALSAFRYYVVDLWRRSLQRRSQKDHITWQRVAKLADDWLPRSSTPGRRGGSPSDTRGVGAVCGNAARTDLCGGALGNERPYRDRAIRLDDVLRFPFFGRFACRSRHNLIGSPVPSRAILVLKRERAA